MGSVTISAIAGDEGKLFGSIGVRELEDAINAAGGEISKSEINLPDGAFRHIGEFAVEVQLHFDVVESVTVVIEAE
jgi:large subunit ribosomal protein L9